LSTKQSQLKVHPEHSEGSPLTQIASSLARLTMTTWIVILSSYLIVILRERIDRRISRCSGQALARQSQKTEFTLTEILHFVQNDNGAFRMTMGRSEWQNSH